MRIERTLNIVNKSPHELPTYSHFNDSGMDMRVWIGNGFNYILPPNENHIFNTGIHIDIPNGKEIVVRSRSGLFKIGTIVDGTIDSGYKGEIKLSVWNVSKQPIVISDGDRLCQIVLQDVTDKVVWNVVNSTDEFIYNSERGDGGFGHTGLK